MKKYLLGFLCVAVASTAWAQSPTSTLSVTPAVVILPAGQGETMPVRQVAGISILGQRSCGADCGSCITTSCAPATKWVCEPCPTTVITKKISYSSVCEKICYPKCVFKGFMGGCCNSCDTCTTGCDKKCESHVYQKKYLVKHVCITECPATKCVAVEVPVCVTPRCVTTKACCTPCAPACAPACTTTTPSAPTPIGPPAKKMPATTTSAPAAPLGQTQVSPPVQLIPPAQSAIVSPSRQ